MKRPSSSRRSSSSVRHGSFRSRSSLRFESSFGGTEKTEVPITKDPMTAMLLAPKKPCKPHLHLAIICTDSSVDVKSMAHLLHFQLQKSLQGVHGQRGMEHIARKASTYGFFSSPYYKLSPNGVIEGKELEMAKQFMAELERAKAARSGFSFQEEAREEKRNEEEAARSGGGKGNRTGKGAGGSSGRAQSGSVNNGPGPNPNSNANASRLRKQNSVSYAPSSYLEDGGDGEGGSQVCEEPRRLHSSYTQKFEWLSLPFNSVASFNGKTQLLFIYELLEQDEILKMMPEDPNAGVNAGECRLREAFWATIRTALATETPMNDVAVVWAVPDTRLLRALKEVPKAVREELGSGDAKGTANRDRMMTESIPFLEEDQQRHLHVRLILYANDAAFVDPTVSAASNQPDKTRGGAGARFPSGKKNMSKKGNASGDSAASRPPANRGSKGAKGGNQKNAGTVATDTAAVSINYFEPGVPVDELLFKCTSFADFIEKQSLVQKQKAAIQKLIDQGKPPQSECHPQYLSMVPQEEMAHEFRPAASLLSDSLPNPFEAQLNKLHVFSFPFSGTSTASVLGRPGSMACPPGKAMGSVSVFHAASDGTTTGGTSGAPSPFGFMAGASNAGSAGSSAFVGNTAGSSTFTFLPPEPIWTVVRVNPPPHISPPNASTTMGKSSSVGNSSSSGGGGGAGVSGGPGDEEWVLYCRKKAVPAIYDVASMVSLYNYWGSKKQSVELPIPLREKQLQRLAPGLVRDKRDMFFPHQQVMRDLKIFMLGRSEEEWRAKNGPTLESGLQIYESEKLLQGEFIPFMGVMALISQATTNLARLQPLRLVQFADPTEFPPILSDVAHHQASLSHTPFRRDMAILPSPEGVCKGDNRGTGSVKGAGRREDEAEARSGLPPNHTETGGEEESGDGKKTKSKGGGAGGRKKSVITGKSSSADKSINGASFKFPSQEKPGEPIHSSAKTANPNQDSFAAWVFPMDYCHHSSKGIGSGESSPSWPSQNEVDALVSQYVQKGLGKLSSSKSKPCGASFSEDPGIHYQMKAEKSQGKNKTSNANRFLSKKAAPDRETRPGVLGEDRDSGAALRRMEKVHHRIGLFRRYASFVQHLNLFSYQAALRDSMHASQGVVHSLGTIPRSRSFSPSPNTGLGKHEWENLGISSQSFVGADLASPSLVDPADVSAMSLFPDALYPRAVEKSILWHQGPQDFLRHLTRPLTHEEEKAKLSVERHLTAREKAHIIQTSFLIEVARAADLLPSGTSMAVNEFPLVIEEVISLSTALHRMASFPLRFGDHIAAVYAFASPEVLQPSAHLLQISGGQQEEKRPQGSAFQQESMARVGQKKEAGCERERKMLDSPDSSHLVSHSKDAENVYPTRRALQYWVCGIPIPKHRRKNLVWAFPVSGNLTIEQYTAWKRWEWQRRSPSSAAEMAAKSGISNGKGSGQPVVSEPFTSPHSGPVTFAPQNVYYLDDRPASTIKDTTLESDQQKDKEMKQSRLAANFLEKLITKVLEYKCTHISQPCGSQTYASDADERLDDMRKPHSSTRSDPTVALSGGVASDGGATSGNTGIIPINIGSRGSMFEAPFSHGSRFVGDATTVGLGNQTLLGGGIKSSFELGKDLYLAAEGRQILYPYCDAVVEVVTTNYSRQCRYLAAQELTATLHYNIPLPLATISSFSSADSGNPFAAATSFHRGSPPLPCAGAVRNRMAREDWCGTWMQALQKSSSVEEESYLTVRFDDGLTVTIANRAKPLMVASSPSQRRPTKPHPSEAADRFTSPGSVFDGDTTSTLPAKPAEPVKRGTGRRNSEKRRSREKHGSSRKRSSVGGTGSNSSFSGDLDRLQGTEPTDLYAAARLQLPLCPPIAANGDIRLWTARGGAPPTRASSSPALEFSFLNSSTYNGGNSSIYSGSVAPGASAGVSVGGIVGGPGASTPGTIASATANTIVGSTSYLFDDHLPRRSSFTLEGVSTTLTMDMTMEGEEDRNTTLDPSTESARYGASSDTREFRVEPLDITIASTNFVFHTREREGILWFSYFFSGHGGRGQHLSRHPETIWAARSNIGAYSTMQPSLELEVRRAVIESTGVVVRYFESGATQTLFPDGSISYQCKEVEVHPLSTASVPFHSSNATGGGTGGMGPASGSVAEMGDVHRTQKKKPTGTSFMNPDSSLSFPCVERICETLLLSSGGVYVRSVSHGLPPDSGDNPAVDSTVDNLGVNEPSNECFTRLAGRPIAPLLIQYDPTSHCHTITREDGVIVVYYYYCNGEESDQENNGKDEARRKKKTNKTKGANSATDTRSSFQLCPSKSRPPYSSSPFPPSNLIHPSPPAGSSGPSSGFTHLPPGACKLEARLQHEVTWDGSLNAGDNNDGHDSARPHHSLSRFSYPLCNEAGKVGISLDDIPEVYARVTLHPDGTTITTFGDQVEKLVGQQLPPTNREVSHPPPIFPTPNAPKDQGKTASKSCSTKTDGAGGGMWSTPVDADMNIPVMVDSNIAPSVSSLVHDMWMVQATCHGKVKWCVESVRTPRIFLASLEERLNQMGHAIQEWHLTQHGRPAPPEEIERLQVWGGCRSPYGAFYLVFGDGSVLKRHIFSRPTRGTVVPFLETIFSRPTDTVLRMIHDNGMVIVERREDVQRNQENFAAAAIGEGFAVFDLALGGFRLVDYLSHVTQVQDLYSPFGVTSRMVPVPWEVLLQELVHETYSSHRLPKGQMARLLAQKEVEEAKDRRLRAAGLCPSLLHRMQELAEEFVISHGLLKPDVLHTLEKESLSFKGLHKVDLKKAAVETQVGSGGVVTTMIGRIPPAFFCQRANMEIIQMMNARTMGQEVEKESSRTNGYLYKEPMYLLRSIAIGEPGVQQLSLFRVQYQLSSSSCGDAKRTLGENCPSSIPALLNTGSTVESPFSPHPLMGSHQPERLRPLSLREGSLMDRIQCLQKLSCFHNGLSANAHYQHADGGVYDSTIADPCLYLGNFSRWHPRECQPPRHFLKPPVQKPLKGNGSRVRTDIVELNYVEEGEEGAQKAMKLFPPTLVHDGVRIFLQFQPVSPLTANTVLHSELERDMQLSELSKYHHVVEKAFQEVPSDAMKEQKRLQKLYFAMRSTKKKR